MSKPSPLRTLVVDDHEVVRRGLISALDRCGGFLLDEAGSYEEATNRVAAVTYDLAIIDHNLGKSNGLDLALAINLSHPLCRTILLTFEEDWQLIERTRRSGFAAFISKSTPLQQVTETITQVRDDGEGFLLRIPDFKERKHFKSHLTLTPTEIEIMKDLSRGLRTSEIAHARHNSEATIKSHLTSIYRKLGARNRVEALRIASEISYTLKSR